MSSNLKKETDLRYLVLYFALAFGLSWAILIPEALAGVGLLPFEVPDALLLLAGFGPALAATLVAAIEAGQQGVRKLMRRLFIVRVRWVWYLVALLGPALPLLVGRFLEDLLGGAPPPIAAPSLQGELGFGQLPVPLFLLGLFINNLVVTLGEEVGWRGFALPRIQARQTLLGTGIILGLLWGLWHVPLIWTPATHSAVAELPFLAFLIDITATSVLYVWLFNHTRGSVAIAALAHAANNTTAVFLMPAGVASVRQFLLTIVVRLVAVALVLLLSP